MAPPRRTPAIQHRYIVDASVVRAASPGQTDRAQASRQFMMGILKGQHFLVMTDEIRVEWENHASRWSTEWYASLTRKRQVRWASPSECAAVSARIEAEIDAADFTNDEKRAMKKDLLLVAAAVGTNREIVTLDDECRTLYERLADSVPEVRGLRWLNPLTDPPPMQPR